MSHRVSFTERDEGKRVIHDDNAVGLVIYVKDGDAYVNPNPGITDTMMTKLGWADVGEDTIQLQEDHIERVTDDAIHLSERL